jgi:hypothetical protein
MKKLLLASAISALTLSGALACEHDRQAANTDRTTVASAGGNCHANPIASAKDAVDELVRDHCTGPNCDRAAPTPVSLRATDFTKPNE